jgi:hypothetical protein
MPRVLLPLHANRFHSEGVGLWGWEGVHWIKLAQGKHQTLVLVNMAISIGIPTEVWNFFFFLQRHRLEFDKKNSAAYKYCKMRDGHTDTNVTKRGLYRACYNTDKQTEKLKTETKKWWNSSPLLKTHTHTNTHLKIANLRRRWYKSRITEHKRFVTYWKLMTTLDITALHHSRHWLRTLKSGGGKNPPICIASGLAMQRTDLNKIYSWYAEHTFNSMGTERNIRKYKFWLCSALNGYEDHTFVGKVTEVTSVTVTHGSGVTSS